MKHPLSSTLQEYFENELNDYQSHLVRDHLLNCNSCTHVLSQMAKVDTHFKNSKKAEVSCGLKARILTEANVLLAEKREIYQLKTESQQAKIIERKEKIRKINDKWIELASELKVPMIQLASVTAMITFLLLSNRVERKIIYEPFDDKVMVMTHSEYDAPLPSGEDE